MATRICINTSDIVLITGLSERTARRILRRVRSELGKHDLDPVTITQFCKVTKMDEKEVRKAIFGLGIVSN